MTTTHKLFSRSPQEAENADSMTRVLTQQGIEYHHPNYGAAPWHIKFEVNGHTFEGWPHRYKCCITGQKSGTGYKWLLNKILWARANTPEDACVIEGD
jgi:hypothetical protein